MAPSIVFMAPSFEASNPKEMYGKVELQYNRARQALVSACLFLASDQ